MNDDPETPLTEQQHRARIGAAVALARPAGPDFADLAAKVGPSVVRVSVTGKAKAAAELPPELRGIFH